MNRPSRDQSRGAFGYDDDEDIRVLSSPAPFSAFSRRSEFPTLWKASRWPSGDQTTPE